ncbi:hypothetical protein M8C21_005701 [Ambrosia artemisiifolia]|uniref:Uncharacterized protein n=1 Tax=Ambrosia artemisiifolia TaxID=4212 RepID=A0AAD5GHW3_AMBAR|nr:hypothetical protein M8C21_005701 [Ambrosia artemisiifolia]
MEDPEAEWKIQQYYSSSSNSKEDDQPSVVRRILSNGYAIGKEFVITGIFISSAPLVVPSIVAVSAVGFVFTVPFGVLLTSYVCTNKIMSMLFPAPVPSPLRLEYYYSDGDGDEDYERMDCKLGLGLGLDDDVVEKYEGDYGGEVEGYVTDGEDNEVVEDVNEEVEKEIGFGFGFEFADDNRQLDDYGAEVEGYVADKEDKEIVEDVNEEVEVEIVFEFDDDSRREGETSTANADEDVEEMEMEDDILQREINDTKDKERVQMEDVEQAVEMRSSFDVVGDGDQGYEEDAGEYLEGDDDSLEEELKGEKLLVDDRQEVNEDSKVMEVGRVDHVNNTIEDGCVVSEGASNVVLGDVETNKPVTSVNASDVIFGEIKDVETTKQVTSERSSNAVFGDDDDVGTTEPVTVIEIESEKLIEKGNKNDEPIGEMRHVVILSDGNDANNFNSQVVDELDLVAREVMGDANKDERTIESAKEVLRKSMGTQGNNGSDAYKDGSEDAFMLSMEEHLVHSNADALEINQEDLLDERNTNTNLKVGNEVKENVDDVDVPSKRNMDNGNEVKKNVVDDNVKHNTDNGNEVKENTTDDIGNEVKKDADDDNVDVVARAPSKHETDTDNANVVYKKMSSREENLDEEKIWEKIAAMRTIVGYKAPTQPTCIGELKALYVFTGVEPPASFDADSDLDAKLKFLMAIVGVK